MTSAKPDPHFKTLRTIVSIDQDMLGEEAILQESHTKPAVRSFSPSPNGSPAGAKRSRRWIVVMTLLTAGAGGTALTPQIRKSLIGEVAENMELVTAEVTRGPFRVSVIERGRLDSLKSTTLFNTVEGSTTIISIIPEGMVVKGPVRSKIGGVVENAKAISADETNAVTVRTTPHLFNNPLFLLYLEPIRIEHTVLMRQHTRVLVKAGDEIEPGSMLAGDVVCELDSSVIAEKYRDQLTNIIKSEGELRTAREALAIQIKQNESDIAAAQLAMDLAQLDLEKYKQGEATQEELTIRGEIKLAEQTLAQSAKNTNSSARTSSRGSRACRGSKRPGSRSSKPRFSSTTPSAS